MDTPDASNLFITKILSDASRFNAYLRLFKQCFPNANKYTYQYLKWLYLDNPFGSAIGFDALVGDQVVAHYAVIPAPAKISHKDCLVCWSLNTATHPNYQGLGLFIKLAGLTYEFAKKRGYIAIIGIANKNSTLGFIKKLSFKLLGQQKIRFGYFNSISLLKPDINRRVWPEELLSWRLSNPSEKYYYRQVGSKIRIYTFTQPFDLPVLLYCCEKNIAIAEGIRSFAFPSLLKPTFFISFNYNASGFYCKLPNKIFPSPWNVIYRILDDSHTISSSNISICGFDSDTF